MRFSDTPVSDSPNVTVYTYCTLSNSCIQCCFCTYWHVLEHVNLFGMTKRNIPQEYSFDNNSLYITYILSSFPVCVCVCVCVCVEQES